MQPLNNKNLENHFSKEQQDQKVNFSNIPREVVKMIFDKLSPFEVLRLSTVSMHFDAQLNDDFFWSKFKNLINEPEYGLTMRSQFVLRAIFEYQLMKRSLL